MISLIKGTQGFYPDAAYNFVDVRDVARGLILAAERGEKGECYILSGEQISLAKLISLIERFIGKVISKCKVPLWLCKVGAFFSSVYCRMVKKLPLFTNESISILASNSTLSFAKAWSCLGFRPRPLVVTMKDTMQWFKAYFKIGDN
jgi:dihydroflavonol-4-reductase